MREIKFEEFEKRNEKNEMDFTLVFKSTNDKCNFKIYNKFNDIPKSKSKTKK